MKKRKTSTLAQRRMARKKYEQIRKTTKPGSGKRFEALSEIARLGGAENPEAVAGKIMWKTYGKEGGIKLIKMGKRRQKMRSKKQKKK